jgi:ribA/ribD-fused uncharacterized protein
MAITEFRGEYRWLSNFWPVEVEWQGHIYPSTEHAYQAAKTNSLQEREEIREAKTCGKAKRLGQKVTIQAFWDDKKVEVMRILTRRKFKDPHLKEKLILTARQHLVEGNAWGDTFWGVCEGNGENHLGRILMDIRAEIIRENSAT